MKNLASKGSDYENVKIYENTTGLLTFKSINWKIMPVILRTVLNKHLEVDHVMFQFKIKASCLYIRLEYCRDTGHFTETRWVK